MIQALETERGISPETVGQFCAEYGEQLTRSLPTRNRAVAPDAIQELWLDLLRHSPPDDVSGDSQRLFAWLLTALRRRAVDLVRRECLRTHLALNDARFAEAADGESVRVYLGERVRRTVDHLAANGAGSAVQLLELRFLEGQSVAGIARLLAISPRAVSSRLQRAKRKFRAVWIATGGDSD